MQNYQSSVRNPSRPILRPLRGGPVAAGPEGDYLSINQPELLSVQHIEERDPVRPALLEVFAALKTAAKHSDFDYH
jgi:hypothetical protein